MIFQRQRQGEMCWYVLTEIILRLELSELGRTDDEIEQDVRKIKNGKTLVVGDKVNFLYRLRVKQ